MNQNIFKIVIYSEYMEDKSYPDIYRNIINRNIKDKSSLYPDAIRRNQIHVFMHPIRCDTFYLRVF